MKPQEILGLKNFSRQQCVERLPCYLNTSQYDDLNKIHNIESPHKKKHKAKSELSCETTYS